MQTLFIFVWWFACIFSTLVTTANISDRYIILLKPDVDIVQHLKFVENLYTKIIADQPDKAYQGITHQYNISDALLGYAGHFDNTTIARLKIHHDVATIESDKVFVAEASVPNAKIPPTYGLGLLSHRGLENMEEYLYDKSAGKGTFGYVVDSGINIKHVEFEKRASKGYNACKPATFEDDNGHGTAMAGLMGSKTFGVAKKTKLIAVKVLNKNEGTTAALLDGYQWAVNDIVKRKRQSKAVVNCSWYGAYSPALNKAVDVAWSQNVTTVVCSGNVGEDADNYSPASAEGAITVGATDWYRKRHPASNWGDPVDIFAAGVNIYSPAHVNKTAIAIGSGTSQAAAYVAGLVLYLKGMKKSKLPDALATKAYVLELATKDVVKDPKGSHNRFVYNGSGK
ncbi:subtilisin-like protein [Myriangium duriaei CBS 260.36]|uniref:Subtilisin-like protein n=1 Tax=Myriangium duriaei CBS 260.36 TaxID=1168546 RepID=A0A9P4MHJ0_9PEZI|nr:subtilisin-like protein [Myriangium duriaei CBS 260.36]